MNKPTITVTEYYSRSFGRTMYMAHGPGEVNMYLLMRPTRELALEAGEAYMLETRELNAAGEWVLKDY